MKRRKKKVNPQQSKQEYGARLKVYKSRIYHFLELLGCEELKTLINRGYLRGMYYKRNNNLPIIRQSVSLLSGQQSVHDMQADLDELISIKEIEIYPDGPLVSPREVMVYITLIHLLALANEQSTDPNVLRIVKQFRDKAPDINKLYRRANEIIDNVMSYLGLKMTHFNKRICWLEYVSKNQGKNFLENNIMLVEKIPQALMVVIDNHPRPVYRLELGFPSSGLLEVSISSEQLKLDQSIRNMLIPVYLQNHVLHRLEERLDCLTRMTREIHLYASLKDPKISQFKGRTLVEYNMGKQKKMGYLVVEYLDGILLVKTFLLLSNSGTPEGQRLEASSGMKKIDRQYWAIDRLSTFQQSDMKDNTQLKEVFEQAGCGSLFNEIPALDTGQEIHANQAAQMLQYLNMDKVEEQMLVDI